MTLGGKIQDLCHNDGNDDASTICFDLSAAYPRLVEAT